MCRQLLARLASVATAILVFGAQPAVGADWSSAATLRVDGAVSEASRELQTAETVADLDFGVTFQSGWTAKIAARLRYDTEDRLEPGRPRLDERSDFNRRWLLGDSADAELRELYVDGQVGRASVRIGKQQVVWGQADGLRVLDVVNPFSFREFVWPDPQDRRIPLWTVKTEVPLGGATLQLLWLPDPTYDEIPLGAAAFAVTTPLLVPQAAGPVEIRPVRRPSGVRDGSDAGARLAMFIGGWDVTLNYLYHYYDDPVPFVAMTAGGPALEPAYERSRLFGATVSNAFGSTTVRAELGYSTDRWFITRDPADLDRVFASDEVAFVVGLDNTAVAATVLSLQYFDSQVREPQASMTRSRHERQATLLMQRSFRNDSVRMRALWLRSLNRDDGAIQARLSWQMSANLAIAVSMERFYGVRQGLFGEFRDASRAGVELQWSWLRQR
jgi:hypothetical protein